MSSSETVYKGSAVLAQGAENSSLPGVGKALPELEVLELEWSPRYVVVSDGKIMQTVQAALTDTELRLLGMRVRFSKLRAVLESMGTRLRCFDTNLQSQEEPSLIR